MEHGLFRDGYVAGWRSVEGADENPPVPASPGLVGEAMYLLGFSRGVRDARIVTLKSAQRSPSDQPR
jgi:hypothetical protein